MAHDDHSPAELCTATSELEAPWIVGYLGENGVEAHVQPVWTAAHGGYSRSRIIVRRSDLERARGLMRRRKEELEAFDPTTIDWSQVDTGDQSPLREDEVNPPALRLYCVECGFEPEGEVRVNFCPRCGVRSALAAREPRSMGGAAAFWIFAAMLVVFGVGVVVIVVL